MRILSPLLLSFFSNIKTHSLSLSLMPVKGVFMNFRKSDQIIEVNGKPLQGLSLLDAYQSFRSLKAGPIVLVIKRGENFLVRGHTSIALKKSRIL